MNSTKEYSIFKDFSSNREVDPKHVNRLMLAIKKKNLLYVNPIIVDREMRVIDGQHRLAAAQILQVEIFYIEATVDRKDISVLNSNQKNWKAMDYINYYTVEHNHSFQELSKLMNKFPQMKLSALLTLSNSENRRCLSELKEGSLDVLNINEATELCEFIKDLANSFEYSFVYDSRFPLALLKAYKAENFDPDTLKRKIEAAPRSFVQCHTAKQYMEMIQECYNRGMSKNIIKLV
jgi:hypothetical protein